MIPYYSTPISRPALGLQHPRRHNLLLLLYMLTLSACALRTTSPPADTGLSLPHVEPNYRALWSNRDAENAFL